MLGKSNLHIILTIYSLSRVLDLRKSPMARLCSSIRSMYIHVFAPPSVGENVMAREYGDNFFAAETFHRSKRNTQPSMSSIILPLEIPLVPVPRVISCAGQSLAGSIAKH